MNPLVICMDTLKSENIDEWKLLRRSSKVQSQYLTKGGKIDTELNSNRDDVYLTVYNRKQKTLGEGCVHISNLDPAQISSKIKQAKGISASVKNKVYDLPEPAIQDVILELSDPKLLQIIKQNQLSMLIDSWSTQIIKGLKGKKSTVLNNMEIIVSKDDSHIINSNGANVTNQKTKIYLEMTLTSKQGKKEQEFFRSKTLCRLRDLNLKGFLRENIKYAKDSLNAITPKDYSGPVVISDDAIQEFFYPHLNLSPLVFHATAKAKYSGLSRYGTNKQLFEDQKGDLLTLWTNPFVPFNPAGSLFDEDGVPSKKVLLISKGSFCKFHAQHRYAQYLKIPPSGALGVIEVGTGTRNESQIRRGEFMEIVSFASFVPNMISGDFSAEIRLGYMYKKGKKIPFRGGMFTGNVFKLFTNFYASTNSIIASGYKGPSSIRFEEGNIAGV